MKNNDMYNNVKVIMKALEILAPVFDGENITLYAGEADVVISGANRPGMTRMTVSAQIDGQQVESIDYLFDPEETARIARQMCKNQLQKSVNSMDEELIYTENCVNWQDGVTVGTGAELECSTSYLWFDSEANDEESAA